MGRRNKIGDKGEIGEKFSGEKRKFRRDVYERRKDKRRKKRKGRRGKRITRN